MDIRASLNDDSLNVLTGDGQISFLENDSFFAKAPPLAASTVGRTKSRRFMQESEMGSFLDDTPRRVSPLAYDGAASQGPARRLAGVSNAPSDRQGGDLPQGLGEEWSVVNSWCRENKDKIDKSEYDGKSSLGILDVDDMDVSSTNLLLEGPMEDMMRREAQGDQPSDDSHRGSSNNSEQSNHSGGYSHLKSTLKEQGSTDQGGWSSSQNSLDSKPDQPFASSQVMTTVKKGTTAKENKREPMAAAIRQMLFAQTPIGEEGEDGDTSVHKVELGEQDLNELDDDFDMNLTTGDESDKEDTEKTPVNKQTSGHQGEDSRLDSMYLRPGAAGEESTHTARLPYLSKVSLFEGGSESEIDTEDELEIARKGTRAEAAGEASQQDTSRPGVVGRCSDDTTGMPASSQVPLTQRQSAEGDAVSPIPGDGGGGGDGSSGSDSEDAQRISQVNNIQSNTLGYHGNRLSQDQEEQRIRPMGDDLLSEIRLKRYDSDHTAPENDTRLASRYLAAMSQLPDDTGTDQDNGDDYFLTQDLCDNFQDFDPSNRLEASGFNADDDQRPDSNPFGAMMSSFGSFGYAPDQSSGSMLDQDGPSGHSADRPNSSGSWAKVRPDTGGSGGSEGWRQLDESRATSRGSLTSSRACSTSPGNHGNYAECQQGDKSRDNSLGSRSAASGSPSLAEKRTAASGSPSGSVSAPTALTLAQPSNQGGMAEPRKDVFKKPTIPPPKVANQNNFRKSFGKLNGSASSSRQMSGTASSMSSASSGSEYVDLAVRMSLTALADEANEQREQLKRVPSLGGTSIMDLTVNDDEFFGNDDALAMLDIDEEAFEEENKIRQDEVMNVKDPSSADDSWQYHSIMTISRPSWLEDPNGEEVVRISVGSFMRSRTEALGSLDGGGREPRPDFGMKINSPPRMKPSQLVDVKEDEEAERGEESFHEARTSGVGQYENTATPTRSKEDENNTLQADDTLTMSKLGLPPIASADYSTKLSLGELSRIFTSDDDVTRQVQQLMSLHASKSKHKVAPAASSAAATSASTITTPAASGGSTLTTATSIAKTLTSSQSNTNGATNAASVRTCMSDTSTASSKPKSPKSSQLPIRKGSSLNRSVSFDNDNSHQPSNRDSNFDSSRSSVEKTLESSTRGKDVTKTKPEIAETGTPVRQSPNHLAPPSQESIEDFWLSPNTSSCAASTVGLFERLEEFQFSSGVKPKNNTTDLLRQNLFHKHDLAGSSKKPVESERRSVTDGGREGTDSKYLPSQDRGVEKSQSEKSQQLKQQFGTSTNSVRKPDPRNIARVREASDGSYLDMDSRRLNDSSRSKSGAKDHGYLLGHHIPDGTEYSEQSDYSHMNHKGMEREDVAGMDEDGLVESRGFDILEQKSSNQNPGNSNVTSNNGGKNILSEKRAQASHNIQPKPAASSPLQKGRQYNNNINAYRHEEQDNVDIDDNDDLDKQKKMESWTQTSTVLKQSVGLQPDYERSENLQPNSKTVLDDNQHMLGLNDKYENEFRKENLPPKLPISSFKHDLLRNTQSAVPQKPHLLTKTSLMKTDFAEDNLQRNFSMEVMDKIYDTTHPSAFNQLSETHLSCASQYGGHPRDSLESRHWTQLRETLDPTEMSHLSDIHSAYSRQPMAQSTPFVKDGQQFFSGLGYTTSKLPTCYEKPDRLLSMTDHTMGARMNETEDHASLSLVEAPSVLKFSDACCVGISRTEPLTLTNPTDRWMECLLQVKCLEIDGRSVELTNFPFEFRQKLIINPMKSETVDVMFLPKFAGAYVAQLQLFSSAFVRKEDIKRNMIPVNVTLQAIAEKPWIKVICDNTESNLVDFGEMVWGSCREKSVTIYNHGLATVPLRLAITSNKSWHCFSFEGTSDVSIISGTRQLPVTAQGRSVININIPGSTSQKNCCTVKIWSKPPEKQITKALARQAPEEFSCLMNIDVDTPSSKLPTLASVRLKVRVGVQKLHVQQRIQEVHLAAAPMKTQDSKVKITNAGNLGLEVSFGFTNFKDMFSVTPNVTYLPPGGLEDITVAFHPTSSDVPSYESELLMYIQPEGPMFEMKLVGQVTQPSGGPLKILCDCTNLNFGGIPLNKTLVKRFRLINKKDEAITMAAESRVDHVMLAESPEPNSPVSKMKELYMRPEEPISVYAVFHPTCQTVLRGKIVMRVVDTHAPKYTVTINGYGGTSKLVCSEESLEAADVRGYPCVAAINKTGEEHSCSIYVNNVGCKTARVTVAVYKDLDCQRLLTGGHVKLQPSEFLIPKDSRQKLDLTTSMRHEDVETNLLHHGVGAALCLSYVDDIEMEKPYRSKLVIGLTRLSTSKDVQGGGKPALNMFATPSVSSRTVSRLPPQRNNMSPQPNCLNFTDNLPSHRSDDVSTDYSARADNTGGWEIRPPQLVLYCSNKGPSEELDKFYIYNHRNRDIQFEISWPAGMLALKPDRGIVKARELSSVMIFPSSEACKRINQLPWSGTVLVQCDGISKPLQVQVRYDFSADTTRSADSGNSPRPLLPASMTTTGHPQPSVSSSRTLGNVEVSKTVVQFPTTSIGKVSQETLLLTNAGSEMLRWIFSSFAPPYLRKEMCLQEADQKKEMIRVTYKVFDFSRQFGKLSGHSSLQLLLQFMPRSSGSFMQYWDLQLTGNPAGTTQAANNNFIRIQLTGECIGESETRERKAPDDGLSSLIPLMVENSNNKIQLQQDQLKFNSVRPGERITHKVELKNSHSDIIKVEVVAPKAPFYIKHHNFKVSGKRYLRLPIDFNPTQLGMFMDIVTFHTANGQTLHLKLRGECTLDDTISQHDH